jgi:predicted nucleotidyltransferase
MLLHVYLDSLLGSKVSIRLVRALVKYPGKVFTVRKLAEAAGVSSSEAALAVQELAKFGILSIQPVGRAYLVSLNEKSYILNRIVRPAIRAEGDTLAELVSVLTGHLTHKSITSAALFGSVAASTERKGSDIDLLVVSDDHEAASSAVAKAMEEIALVFNGRLSPLIMNERELKSKGNSRLASSILDNYILVAGRDPREMVERK